MRKKFFLIMIGILALLIVSVCSSFAKDIDISNMDNAQLMTLLQAIMQKLEEKTEDESPEAPVVTTNPEAADTPESAGFQIYKNKKLVIGRMPDWYFIRDDSAEEAPDEENQGEETPHEKKQDNDSYNCIICAGTDIVTGEGVDCFSIC